LYLVKSPEVLLLVVLVPVRRIENRGNWRNRRRDRGSKEEDELDQG
jgi:hypothetical protein